MKEILECGDLDRFISLVEHEALTLHAMMMMSQPAFILMKTRTIEVIHKVWNFRKDTNLPLFFTLDAGANVHLLFPSDKDDLGNKNENQKRIESFIEKELFPHTQNGKVIKDTMKF